MKDAVLRQSGCAACGRTIDPKWSSGGLAAKCEDCYNVKLFTPENFNFQVAVRTSPHETYDFSGTRLMVNGRVGTLVTCFGNWSWINFSDAEHTIKVGYWEIKRLYESSLVTS